MCIIHYLLLSHILPLNLVFVGQEFRQSTVWMTYICSSMPEVSAGRPNAWELESSGVSFAHMSPGSCLPSVRSLGSSPHVFLCVVSLWATLGFPKASGLGSSFPGGARAKAKERERREYERERSEAISFFLTLPEFP